MTLRKMRKTKHSLIVLIPNQIVQLLSTMAKLSPIEGSRKVAIFPQTAQEAYKNDKTLIRFSYSHEK
jgi:hypothetical protein